MSIYRILALLVLIFGSPVGCALGGQLGSAINGHSSSLSFSGWMFAGWIPVLILAGILQNKGNASGK